MLITSKEEFERIYGWYKLESYDYPEEYPCYTKTFQEYREYGADRTNFIHFYPHEASELLSNQ